MDWIEFLINDVTVLAQGCLHLLFSCHFTGKRRKTWHFAIYLPLLYAADAVGRMFQSDGLAIGLLMLALYGVNRLLLGSSRPASCVTTIIAVYVAQLSFGIINSIEISFFPYTLGKMPLIYLMVLLATLLSLALCVCCYWFLSERFSLRDDRREPYIWMLLPPSVFFFAVELYIMNINYSRVPDVPDAAQAGKHLALLALQSLGLAALFSALYAYRRTCDGFRAKAALASLAQETQAQKIYVAQAQLRYERTRAFRHDIKNHLSVLDGLLKGGKVSQAQGYLQKLEAVTGGLSFPVHTGNPVVDVLLGDKLELARTGGAKADVSLELPNPCGVGDLDLCVVFANALDNAIQACARMDGNSPKWIHIAGERQGDFYMLEFENSCPPGPGEGMGIGLANVKAVAEKYGGAMTWENACPLFRLNVLLNISLQSDDSSIQSA